MKPVNAKKKPRSKNVRKHYVENPAPQKPPVERRARSTDGKKPRKKWSVRKKVIVFTILTIVLIPVVIAIVYLSKATGTLGQVFEGNPMDFLTHTDEQLKKDQYGRSNVLLFGTSEDDEGHSGADLADSIMVLSVDQESKATSMLSIPRDLWVNYEEPCSVGYSGKINATYICAMETHGGDQKAASAAFARKVSEVLGTEIQYYAAVNYSVVRDLTNALGGIDVDIYSDDPRGIYDVATKLSLPAGINHLDGEQALQLARARNSQGGYGLSRSNFDREQNQQRIIKAMQKKATVSSLIFDPNKVLSILDSIGNNIRTNVTMAELRTALDLSGEINTDKITSLSLTDGEQSLVSTGMYNGQSIVQPILGLTDYSGIQEYIRQSFSTSVQDPLPSDAQPE